MRHKLSGRQLSRNSPHRHALMRNLSVALLRYETIRTTLPKAKELRRVAEPLITLGKTDTDANRQLAFSRLRDTAVVDKLFGDLGPRFQARAGGYTRILRMMPRPGDSAPMALMQLVDGPKPATAEGTATTGAAATPARKKPVRRAPPAKAKVKAKAKAKATGKAKPVAKAAAGNPKAKPRASAKGR